MEQRSFGKANDGTEYTLYSFTNKNNVTMTVTDLGASLVSVIVPDKDGIKRDVVLGYDTPQEYLDHTCYFGAVIGRSGNRIDKGRFTINETTYQLAVNDNENNLHSGPDGFDRRKWQMKSVNEEKNSILFLLFSPDGDEGYPGNCQVAVTYMLTDDNEVVLHYEADSDADTVMNLTNHSYFNLGGHDSGTILEHQLKLAAPYYTPVRDHQAIPTGEIVSVTGTPMDFTAAKTIGQDIEADFEQLTFVGGYDHNFVLEGEVGEMKPLAEAYCEKTGIALEAFTTCSAFQFYAGNFITDQKGKGGADYKKRQGFCLESQYVPDSINQDSFESPLLRAGEHYDSTTLYRFVVK